MKTVMVFFKLELKLFCYGRKYKKKALFHGGKWIFAGVVRQNKGSENGYASLPTGINLGKRISLPIL